MRAARSKAHALNWPTFAPPQWPGFGPPLTLDRKNVLIADEAQARGTIDHVPVYPREVVKRALSLNASALILVHNHPSGDPTPSEADITMTQQIKLAAETLGMVLHDHLIIGKSCETSFKSEGLI